MAYGTRERRGEAHPGTLVITGAAFFRTQCLFSSRSFERKTLPTPPLLHKCLSQREGSFHLWQVPEKSGAPLPRKTLKYNWKKIIRQIESEYKVCILKKNMFYI
ncbi:hypothetical protein CEXT_39991 [Caerostris extrusa]|uniref:Uncharacterized protein n=1 Tax=Caerostris extrusa TaxID=172846 RepID=A0AAV4MQ41_CAEEX|nr:hypothetical protein CEXT_39991 [Caerostris extrusa]